MTTNQTVPMDQYLRPLLDHTKLILAIAAVVTLLGALASLLVPARYRSTASILVTPISSDPTETLESDVAVDMPTEERIATSTAVVVMVTERLADESGDVGYEELASNVSTSSPRDSRILDISYTASTAPSAQRGAEVFAQTYLDYRSQLADENKMAIVGALEERIAFLKDQLGETTSDLTLFPEGSASYIEASVERESISSELEAQQAALANLSTLSVDVGRIISPAELPDDPEGLSTLAVVFGSLMGGLVLGCLGAFMTAAVRSSRTDAGSESADAAGVGTGLPEPGEQDTRGLLPGDHGSSHHRISPARPAQLGSAVDERRASVDVPPDADDDIAALFRPDLWDAEHAGSSVGGRSGNGAATAADSGLVTEPEFIHLLARLGRGDQNPPVSWLCVGEASRDASLAIALGLADQLKDRGARVLIVDLLFDHPVVGSLLQIPGNPGLLDVLKGDVAFAEGHHAVSGMGRLRAMPVGGDDRVVDRHRFQELVNGWGMRSLMTRAVSTFDATLFVGGRVGDVALFDLVVREADGIVVGTEQPVGRPIRPELAEELSKLPAETLGLVSLDSALAASERPSDGASNR